MFWKNLKTDKDEVSEFYKIRPLDNQINDNRLSPEDVETMVKSGRKIHTACSFDVETTGLDDTAEVIELAILEIFFENFNGKYSIVGFGKEFNQLQQPKKPIPELITNLTGITDADVKGHSIDWKEASSMYLASDLCLAHNSRFDYGKLKGLLFEESTKVWACSLSDINWSELGFINQKQENLLLYHGISYSGHRALTDLHAQAYLLSLEDYFDIMLKAAKVPQYIVCALNTDFETKDSVQARGFRWYNNNVDKKFYYKMVSKDELEEEVDWVTKNGYTKRRAQVRPISIDPMKRYDSLDALTSSL